MLILITLTVSPHQALCRVIARPALSTNPYCNLITTTLQALCRVIARPALSTVPASVAAAARRLGLELGSKPKPNPNLNGTRKALHAAWALGL